MASGLHLAAAFEDTDRSHTCETWLMEDKLTLCAGCGPGTAGPEHQAA